MGGVVLGFSIVAMLAITGVVVAVVSRSRAELIQRGLTPLVYYVTNPCLMIIIVAGVDVREVASVYVPLALVVALLTAGLFVLFGMVVKRSAAETAVGAMASSYANVGNIGVPVALYAVGSTAPVVAFILVQLLVLAPTYLLIFGIVSHRESSDAIAHSRLRMVLTSMLNPTTTGVIIGAVLSLTGVRLPAVLWEPLQMTGEASIPLMLMIFGMTLYRRRPYTDVSRIADSLVASFSKVLVMPSLAFAVGGPLAGLQGAELLGLVAMAALPTAQNVLLFAAHFRMPENVGKDAILTSSLLSLPATLAAAWLIAV